MSGDRPNPRLLLDLDDGPPVVSCESTQLIAKELALRGAPEGTCVTALEQTAGRGRRDHVWHSPSGMGLWMSFLLRPTADQSVWPALTPLTALSVSASLEALRISAAASAEAGPRAGGSMLAGQHAAMSPSPDLSDGVNCGIDWTAWIKWPNDLYGRCGKMGGILAETAGDSMIIGLGLNLEQEAGDFPEELWGRASSLRIEGFSPVPDARTVARAFNLSLTRAYARFQNGELGFLREGLLKRFMLRDRKVRLTGAGGAVEGIARDLGGLGELILETADDRRSVISGEIEILEPPSFGRGS